MKKIILAVITALILSVSVDAQILSQGAFSGNAVSGFSLEGIISGADTFYTNSFRLPQRTANVFMIASQENDSIFVAVKRQISLFEGLWQDDKAIGTDSVTTVKVWADTSSYKDVWHRLMIYSTGDTGGDCSYKIRLSTD